MQRKDTNLALQGLQFQLSVQAEHDPNESSLKIRALPATQRGQRQALPCSPSPLPSPQKVLSVSGPFLRGVGLTVIENLAAFLDQALPVRSPKPSHNEVEPEGPGKEQDLDFRDELQKKTLQLLAKEKEVRW